MCSAVDVRPGCATVSSSRASGYGRSIACSRSRGQPLDSKRQIVVIHKRGGVAVAVHEDDRRQRGAAAGGALTQAAGKATAASSRARRSRATSLRHQDLRSERT